MIKLGIDRLCDEPALQDELHGQRLALLGHSASVNAKGQHSLACLMSIAALNITAAFGPQHGMRGEKQDNMQETADEISPHYGIPVFSLYGETRYPTPAMLETFDTLLVDLQDIGTRIYTYVTTLAYMLEACGNAGKKVVILDRPNPAGRPNEGTILASGWESFVGVGPLQMRHGLTLGELAKWMVDHLGYQVDLQVIEMTDYQPENAPGYGWPLTELAWVNPSPNASSVNMARCFPGTVLFEGTTLSEGRGTTTPLELWGAPDIDAEKLLGVMKELAPTWLDGALLRPCWFEPTFHKHEKQLCHGIQIHTDLHSYQHQHFRPYRIVALFLKALRLTYPDYAIWRKFHYEYETERLAIDLLSGSDVLRNWVDNPNAHPDAFEALLIKDEALWAKQRAPYLLYQVQ